MTKRERLYHHLKKFNNAYMKSFPASSYLIKSRSCGETTISPEKIKWFDEWGKKCKGLPTHSPEKMTEIFNRK